MAVNAVALLIILCSSALSHQVTGRNIVSLGFLLMWTVRITASRNRQIRQTKAASSPSTPV